MMKFLSNLFEAISMFVAVIASILILAAIYNAVDEKIIRPYRNSEQAKQTAAEKETVNTDASNAAKLIASARKGCKVIAYEDINICSGIDGRLPEEKQFISAAKDAVTAREAYFSKCKKHYDESYCTELIVRAYSIALRLQSENPQTFSQ